MSSPRLHRDPQEVERKRARLTEPHVVALTDYVEALRSSKPHAQIPFFDPAEAGIGARILLLLEAPGRRSAPPLGSGFVSPDNNDQTAHNMWLLLRDAGIDRARDVVTWNVVPWYIGDEHKIRAATRTDLTESRDAIQRLIGLLPLLRVVVLLGDNAALGWARLELDSPLSVIKSPHPSPSNLNSRPAARHKILKSLTEAKLIAEAE